MTKVASETRSAPAVLSIPEPSHFQLVQIAYFIRLMAHLTESGTPASVQNARLAPDAIGWCFANLSKEMDAVMSTIQFAPVTPYDDRVEQREKRGSRATPTKSQRATAN